VSSSCISRSAWHSEFRGLPISPASPVDVSAAVQSRTIVTKTQQRTPPKNGRTTVPKPTPRAPQSPRAAPPKPTRRAPKAHGPRPVGFSHKKIPVRPKIPLDTPGVVESTYVHHRHNEPEAQATGARSPPERSPAALNAADDGGKTSARCSHRSTSRKTQNGRMPRRQFSARRQSALLTGCRAGGAPVAPFFQTADRTRNIAITRERRTTSDAQQHTEHHDNISDNISANGIRRDAARRLWNAARRLWDAARRL